MVSFLEHLGSLLPGRTLARPPARIAEPAERKMTGGAMFAIDGLAQPAWSSRNYASYAREGMMRNAVAYRCIRMIAEAASSVNLSACQGLEPVTNHPLLDLIRRPAPGSTSSDLFERWYGTLLVSGNVYLKAVGAGGQIRELHLLRPDRVSIVPGRDGWPAGYEYTIDGRTTVFNGEVLDGIDQVLHVKLFHPADDHYGLSPVEAASNAIDIHNTATLWNKALLDNAARPSGALVYTAGGHLSGEQFDRLKEELEQSFQGARNAGRPMLLEGGLDWKAMSLSPRDMDFIEAKNAAAREIALAMGVPPMLLGIAALRGVGADCLGLLRGVWCDVYGRAAERPPAYMRDWAEAHGREDLIAAADRNLVRVIPGAERPGDVLLFRMREASPAKHVGVMAEATTFIHAVEGAPAAEVHLQGWWRRRIAAAYAFPGVID